MPGPLEDAAEEVARVVDHQHHRRARREEPARVCEHGRHVVDVGVDRGAAGAPPGRADLLGAALVEAEQLERVAVLLVVVDPARVGRRGDQAVEAHAVVGRRGRRRGSPRRARRRAARRTRAPAGRCRACSGAGTWRRRAVGAHTRECLRHSYGPVCGARGKSSSKCVVRRAERAARLSTMRPRSAHSGDGRERAAVAQQLVEGIGVVPGPQVVARRDAARARRRQSSAALQHAGQVALDRRRRRSGRSSRARAGR